MKLKDSHGTDRNSPATGNFLHRQPLYTGSFIAFRGAYNKKGMPNSYKDFEEYQRNFPAPTRELLGQVREAVRRAAPGATEGISYGMPAFKLNGKPLVYFAAFKNHIGFYATPTGHREFAAELAAYKQGKGSVQFPLDRPIPLALIERITRFRVCENLLAASAAKNRKADPA